MYRIIRCCYSLTAFIIDDSIYYIKFCNTFIYFFCNFICSCYYTFGLVMFEFYYLRFWLISLYLCRFGIPTYYWGTFINIINVELSLVVFYGCSIRLIDLFFSLHIVIFYYYFLLLQLVLSGYILMNCIYLFN